MLAPSEIKRVLAEHGITPKKYLGQNFLIDRHPVQSVVSAAEIKKSSTVLEIGPGLGALTQEITARAGRVVAVEKDKELADQLYFIQNASGAVCGPQDSFLVLRGIKTLHVRMQRHCENGKAVAEYLDHQILIFGHHHFF